MAHSPRLAFAALMLGNVVLAFGPWLVRLADVGPIAVGFWRLLLAVPLLAAFAVALRQPLVPALPRTALIILIAAFFFAADLAAWHSGIHLTKLGNATLFGNTSSLLFAAWDYGWFAPGRRRCRPLRCCLPRAGRRC